jgi:hypothetical protein
MLFAAAGGRADISLRLVTMRRAQFAALQDILRGSILGLPEAYSSVSLDMVVAPGRKGLVVCFLQLLLFAQNLVEIAKLALVSDVLPVGIEEIPIS